MLFLLNDRVLDIGLPGDVLDKQGLAGGLSPQRALAFGRETAFAAGGLENVREDVRILLAAMIAGSADANCALFVVPPKARGPGDVAAALAKAPLQTLVLLDSYQGNGRLAPGLVNAHVWSLAQKVEAA